MSAARRDIVVIGAGVAGLSAASELARDAAVVVLEAEAQPGYHSSGRSAAMFLPLYGNATVRALNEASAAHHGEMGVLTPRGMLIVAPEAKTDALSAEAARIGLREIDAGAALERLPILRRDWLAAAAVADGWDLDTHRALQGFRTALAARGGRIETDARVSAITRDGDGWRVSWPGDEIRADHVVNAAGAWADGVAAMAGATPLGLVAHRRSMAQLAAPDGRAVGDWPFVEEVGESWYAKPDAGRWLVSPAEEDPMDAFDAWPDDMVLAEGLARYQAAVVPEVTRPLHTWAGLRTFARDRALVIGADPDARGLWWCAGQGGYGFQTAPAAARHLADLMTGRPPALGAEATAALDPARLVA